jgi:hypothetical protein
LYKMYFSPFSGSKTRFHPPEKPTNWSFCTTGQRDSAEILTSSSERDNF